MYHLTTMHSVTDGWTDIMPIADHTVCSIIG